MSEGNREAYRVARADPEWQAARENYVADKQPSESAGDAMIRRYLAARRMYEIELRAEQA